MTDLIVEMKLVSADSFFGSRTRLMLNAAASASNGSPLWKVTPSRSLMSHVVGAVCSHEVASSGWTSILLSRAARPSKMLRAIDCMMPSSTSDTSKELGSPASPIVTSVFAGAFCAEAPFSSPESSPPPADTAAITTMSASSPTPPRASTSSRFRRMSPPDTTGRLCGRVDFIQYFGPPVQAAGAAHSAFWWCTPRTVRRRCTRSASCAASTLRARHASRIAWCSASAVCERRFSTTNEWM